MDFGLYLKRKESGKVLKGTEDRQDKVQKGSEEGDNGGESRQDKGKGKGRAEWQGREHRGKGVQAGASDGPAGAIVLGSALDTNEVTSRTGTV